jgi:hypothetical protein
VCPLWQGFLGSPLLLFFGVCDVGIGGDGVGVYIGVEGNRVWGEGGSVRRSGLGRGVRW